MISCKGVDNNIVEVDGICFDALMPERLMAIPPIKSYNYVSLQLGIRVTNNTSSHFRFCFYNGFCLLPNILDANKQVIFRGYDCDRSIEPFTSDLLLVLPGEDLIFYPEVFLYWQQNPKKKRSQKLKLSVSFKESDSWVFDINPGVY
ncbi:MAG: hypothetical protein KME01_06265 [Chroococcus sp. CMT-3BRIN-NPC107]|jgi:hypothetical protein|nr:hypothetical protein [Chroococcus sp. CMT-3BRIN-NPC107]